MSAKRYFEILDIVPTKDEKVIKKAYRKKAMRYHPDRNPTDEAHVKFIQLTEAYDHLMIAIEQSKKSPEERQTKNQQKTTPHPQQKTAKEIHEERLRKARDRYQYMKEREAAENEAYFQLISRGTHWQAFKVIMSFSLLIAAIFIIDMLVLPERWEKSSITHTNPVLSYAGLRYSRIVPLRLKTDEKAWVQPAFSYASNNNHVVYIERTYIFRDIKRLWIWDKNNWYFTRTDFSVSGTFPLIPIILFLPFITYLLRGRTLTYSLLFNISLYFFGIGLMLLLYINDRWLHLFTLGWI